MRLARSTFVFQSVTAAVSVSSFIPCLIAQYAFEPTVLNKRNVHAMPKKIQGNILCIFYLLADSPLSPRHNGNHVHQVMRVSCSMRQSQALEASSYLPVGNDVEESVVDLG